MFVYLSKVLPLFFYPLGLACLLLGGIVAADLIGRRWSRRSGVVLAALLLLWLGGNQAVADGLAHSLERRVPAAVAPRAEVIVVLGGATRGAFPPRVRPEISEQGDRLIHAAVLYQGGAAPFLLVSGGRIPWLYGGAPGDSEAADMAALLALLGVPAEAIWQEARSQNTYENAVFSAGLLREKGIDRVILVTSAIHMPRAAALFARQGIEVVPAPADFLVVTTDEGGEAAAGGLGTLFFNLLPQAHHLEQTTLAVKEYIGLVVYWARGWV